MIVDSSLPQSKQVPVSTGTKLFKNKLVLGIAVGVLVFAGLCLIVGIVLIVLFATIPCQLIRCHSRASKCINHAFKPQCICDYPYQGDGRSYCDECGLVYATQNVAKIVGGVNAVANSWPSIAFVQFKYKAKVYVDGIGYLQVEETANCGGNLVDRETVVTAAHCIPTQFNVTYSGKWFWVYVQTNSYYPSYASMLSITLGGQDRSSFGVAPSITVGASSVVKHESFNPSTLQNDIALIKLNKKVDLNNYIQICCLPYSNQTVYPSETSTFAGWIAGWGDLSYKGSLPESLNNVKVTIFTSFTCSLSYSFTVTSWEKAMCAGSLTGGKDTCQGDSGGPLYVQDTVVGQTKYLLVGITSFGYKCGTPGYPGVYTRVSYYNNWIQDTKFYN